jgi:hypothetical protein
MGGGIILGCLTALSMFFSWLHLPNWLKKFFLKHITFTDILVSAIAYVGLSAVSASLVAVSGAIVAGLLINGALLLNRQVNKDGK